MRRALIAILALSACEPIPHDPCRPYSPYAGPMLQQANRVALAACEAEKARQRGATVTTCYQSASGVTCVTE